MGGMGRINNLEAGSLGLAGGLVLGEILVRCSLALLSPNVLHEHKHTPPDVATSGDGCVARPFP